jgi:hypothetical protein
VFKIARQSAFLPEGLFQIFDTLMLEETRHIVFFVNWMAWQEAAKGRGAAWRRALVSARFYARAISRLVGIIRRGQTENDGKDFSATQANVFLDGFTFRRLQRSVTPKTQGAWPISKQISCARACCRLWPARCYLSYAYSRRGGATSRPTKVREGTAAIDPQ